MQMDLSAPVFVLKVYMHESSSTGFTREARDGGEISVHDA
jgi:hypothetical protein